MSWQAVVACIVLLAALIYMAYMIKDSNCILIGKGLLMCEDS